MSSGISGFFSAFIQSYQRTLARQPAAPAPAAAAPPPAATTAPAVTSPAQDQSYLSASATATPSQPTTVRVNLADTEDSPLPDFRSAAEALQELRQRGFINGPEGRESYQYERLSGQSADSLRQLQLLFQRDSQAGRNHKALQFALRVSGATLRDPAERSRYLKTSLLNSREAEHQLNQMAQVLKLKADPQIAQALQNSLAQASERQTINFLYKTGFLIADGMEENGPSIHKKALQHLPQAIIGQLIQNLNRGGLLNPHAPIVQALKSLH